MPILKPDDDVNTSLFFMTMVGFFVIFARLLMWTNSFHSGLLYILLPFGLSLALYYLTPHREETSWKRVFWNNVRYSLIIMLAASLILMEGYVCVIMFMPIYLIFTFLSFIYYAYTQKPQGNSLKVYLLPALVVLLSLEGTTDKTTFNRYNEISYSQVVPGNVQSIKQRLMQPLQFRRNRHWLLSVFPMPRHIGTVKLQAGEVRKYEFVYHRWFVTNSHAGSLDVTFSEVGKNRIKTTIRDDSYISNYMKLHGSEVVFEPVSENKTRVTLTISFDRLLDPVWYFGPLERFAVGKAAKYFVNEILNPATFRKNGDVS